MLTESAILPLMGAALHGVDDNMSVYRQSERCSTGPKQTENSREMIENNKRVFSMKMMIHAADNWAALLQQTALLSECSLLVFTLINLQCLCRVSHSVFVFFYCCSARPAELCLSLTPLGKTCKAKRLFSQDQILLRLPGFVGRLDVSFISNFKCVYLS